MQGVIFLTVQGMGLQSLYLDNCTEISRFIWPGKLPFTLEILWWPLLTTGCSRLDRWIRAISFQLRGCL